MKKNIKYKLSSSKSGSVLIFSLFLMMISLIIGIGLMSTSAVGRKSSLSSTKSVNSFQVADSGIEYAYATIREFRWNANPTHDLLNIQDHGLDNVFGSDNCSGGVVMGTANGGNYTLTFYPTFASTTAINTCTGPSANLVRIKKIKSVGDYNGITRSVEVEVDLSLL